MATWLAPATTIQSWRRKPGLKIFEALSCGLGHGFRWRSTHMVIIFLFFFFGISTTLITWTNHANLGSHVRQLNLLRSTPVLSLLHAFFDPPCVSQYHHVSCIFLLDDVLLYLMLVIEFDLKGKNAVSTNERLQQNYADQSN
jgi:hypothetical protein